MNSLAINAGGLSIPVIRSGPGWLILDKPAGLSVHNEPGADLLSLVNGFFSNRPCIAQAHDFTPEFGFHAVNRLDRSTSGLILAACRQEVLSFLARQFESRTVKKIYRAVLHGHFLQETEQEGGIWNFPLSPDAAGRNDPQGGGRLLPCSTRYRVLARSAHYSLAELEPLTGRMHQIRRHAAMSGHPVAGDRRYGTRRSIAFLSRNLHFERLALHAYGLTLTLPGEALPETIESDGIPADMRALFEEDAPERGIR
ncbi:MAG: RNA pseudouridine synthase [Desulfobacteraceae bacterium]|nr:MAG: RNA pseudouridine synthase [Desulfobacteraceae bacterium]